MTAVSGHMDVSFVCTLLGSHVAAPVVRRWGTQPWVFNVNKHLRIQSPQAIVSLPLFTYCLHFSLLYTSVFIFRERNETLSF